MNATTSPDPIAKTAVSRRADKTPVRPEGIPAFGDGRFRPGTPALLTCRCFRSVRTAGCNRPPRRAGPVPHRPGPAPASRSTRPETDRRHAQSRGIPDPASRPRSGQGGFAPVSCLQGPRRTTAVLGLPPRSDGNCEKEVAGVPATVAAEALSQTGITNDRLEDCYESTSNVEFSAWRRHSVIARCRTLARKPIPQRGAYGFLPAGRNAT